MIPSTYCRLTFWLSNCILLRALISNSFGKSQLPVSVGPVTGKVGYRNGNKKPSALIWGSISSKGTRIATEESFNNWENPLIFASGLERVEAWIFSRIIESIWWQVFTFYYLLDCSGKFLRVKPNKTSSA